MTTDYATWMRKVLDLARKAEGRVSPNPMVGSVVLDHELGCCVCIAEGFHAGPGKWHAEREALLALAEKKGYLDNCAKDCTIVVNLEPCCHFGRTPPCTDIIIQSGVRKVIVGMLDPDPRMAGKGIAKLRDAGIDVVVGVEEDACRHLNDAYLLARTLGRPRFTLKTAISLDGYTASAFGESQWITNEHSRQQGHLLRNTHDGILVGVGTVLADNPSLQTRLLDHPTVHHPRPIVLDTRYRTPLDAKLRYAGAEPIFFVETGAAQPVDRGICFPVSRTNEGLCLEEIASHLVAQGIYSVLLEGGSTIHRSFLAKGWVDRLEIFIAPKLLGGGKAFLSGVPFHLDVAPEFTLESVQSHGGDVQVRYRRNTVGVQSTT